MWFAVLIRIPCGADPVLGKRIYLSVLSRGINTDGDVSQSPFGNKNVQLHYRDTRY